MWKEWKGGRGDTDVYVKCKMPYSRESETVSVINKLVIYMLIWNSIDILLYFPTVTET